MSAKLCMCAQRADAGLAHGGDSNWSSNEKIFSKSVFYI